MSTTTSTLTPEQLEQRKEGLGGSDAAAAIGVNPYKSAVKLYLEKTGEIEPEDLSKKESVEFGIKLEDIVSSTFAERTGKTVHRVNSTSRPKDPELAKFMYAHLDRRIVGEKRVFEAKTAGTYSADQFGAEGTDQVPNQYIVQCHHQMVCYDRPSSAALAVLIGGQRFKHFEIGFDRSLADQIIKKERHFWNLVQTKTPPPPLDIDDLLDLYPVDSGQVLLADDDMVEKIKAAALARKMSKEADIAKDDAYEPIKMAMKAASAIQIAGDNNKPLVTWKKTKDGSKTDWEAMAQDLHMALNEATSKQKVTKFADWVQQYTKVKPGHRMFLIK